MVTMYNFKKTKKLILTVFFSLIFTIFILGSSATTPTVLAADPPPDTTSPTVVILAPISGGYTNSKAITGRAEPNTLVTIWFDGNTSAAVPVTSDASGNWAYSANDLADGPHTVSVTATDAANNTSSPVSSSFTLDTVRPIVLPTLLPIPDAARIPTDTSITIQLQDNSPLDSSSISNSSIHMITTNKDTGAIEDVTGSVSYDFGTKKLIFTPSAALKSFATYYVSVDPNVKDTAGNLVHPRTWSFTTDETTKSGIIDFYANAKPENNPHGNYTNNVYICSNCHSTHLGTSPKLSNPVYPYIDSYCMSCHDGTNAPIPTNWSTDPAVHKHDVQVSMTGAKGASGCTSCHDPHLTWDPNTDPNTNSNSDSLRAYYKYVHNDPTNPTLPSTSEQQLCEACHDPSIKEDSRVTYVQYTYLKQNTATGTPDSTTQLPNDYSLCLRCHDGKIGTDIASFYKTASGHTIKADDGSPMNGNMACADCHETHASQNVKELRQQLGNNKIQGTFSYATGDWNAVTERVFCLKCHNNTTELYGKTIPIKTAVSGHGTADTQSCSSCHGDGDFIKSAHAPKKLP
jgi:hypothetical protein